VAFAVGFAVLSAWLALVIIPGTLAARAGRLPANYYLPGVYTKCIFSGVSVQLTLGLRLTLRSGREALVRLVVTAAAVAVGVALLLGVLAEFHAFQASAGQPCWSCTTGASVPAPLPSHGELWNNSADLYQGQTITRLDVASLGQDAPALPGIPHLPGPGQYYASPALATLLRTAPADQLGDRFPGHMVAAIGDAALSGPDDLVIYIGYAPAALAALPGSSLVTSISAAPAPAVFTPFFRYAFVAGVLAVLFPMLATVAAGIAYGTSILAFVRLAPAGTAVPRLGRDYYALMGLGLAAALAVITATLPLLRRMTSPGSVHFE
jgi:hypothetical protein